MNVNLVPMAGEGKRYKDAGYETPKPLIEVAGLPMVVRAAMALPRADHWIFVVRDEHQRNSAVEDVLEQYFPGCTLVAVDGLTEGQAITCLLARDHIPPNASLTIGASDNDMTYSAEAVEKMFSDESVDGWIWTFRRNPTVLQDPRMYGWVKTKANMQATGISCKVPISENPSMDHAVTGAFTFKRADLFFEAVEQMMTEDKRVRGEFYVDTAADIAIRNGARLKAFEIDEYVGWGTPRDLENYTYWRKYFLKRRLDAT